MEAQGRLAQGMLAGGVLDEGSAEAVAQDTRLTGGG